MPPTIRRHPFLIFGLLTLLLFFVVEPLGRAGYTQAADMAAAPLRILIIPMYVIWLPFTMLIVALTGPDLTPGVLARAIWICGLVAGFAPYALADHLLARRRARENLDAAS